MTLLGYSAEATLYRSSAQYRGALAGLAQSAAVAIPQQIEYPWLF